MYDLIIVGAGPAGCAAAIRAAGLRPHGVSRILLLDRAHFPRVKICGGGVVRRADYLFRRLGVAPDVHSTSIEAARFIFPSGELTIRRRGMFRVVRREELDHALLMCAEATGVQIRQNSCVLSLESDAGSVLVTTAHETFRARVVIGADGAIGIARKTVLSGQRRLSMVGLETFTRPTESELVPDRRRTATFDFSCVSSGVQGYSWDFPAGTEGSPLVNRGIFHSHIGGRASRLTLKTYLEDSLSRRDIAVPREEISGHPAHMYDPSIDCSSGRVLLAGDAIGVEPLLGEGISSALETGMLAADAACHALRCGDYSFRNYSNQIRTSHRMRSILLKRSIAQRFYSGYPRWWILLGAVGLSAAYLRANQALQTLEIDRGSSRASASLQEQQR